MFTGLVQALGEIRSIEPRAAGSTIHRLRIAPLGWRHAPELGDSICVSGVCLTLAEIQTGVWGFDAIPETLARTTLGALKPGGKVNLEPALLPTTALGGHLVQGHVDGIGEVVRVQRGDDWRVRIRPADRSLLRYMVPKGGVCIEGVSLTIASVGVPPAAARTIERAAKAANDPGFEIALIPTTLERTTLGELMPGSMVNIEADITVKTIVHYIENYGAPKVLVAPPPPRGAIRRPPLRPPQSSDRPPRGRGPDRPDRGGFTPRTDSGEPVRRGPGFGKGPSGGSSGPGGRDTRGPSGPGGRGGAKGTGGRSGPRGGRGPRP